MNRTRSALAVLAAATLTLTACGGGNGDSGESTAAAGGDRTPADAGRCTEDKAGGTITMGEYVMLPTFAPGQGNYGVRGGAQSAAVYDRLMRWDPEAAEFEPKLAESLEANADSTVWTLKLRDGVNFSNGDPLTAEDVVYTVNLNQDPATRSSALTEAMQVESMTVVDPQTVEFTLVEPWVGFPSMLAGTVGEVIPQKAHEAADPNDWARNPIGAGAFVLDQYIPDQEVVLTPNPDYYGGPVCADLRFIRIPGSQGTLDAVQTGELQAGFLRGPQFIADADAAGLQGFYEVGSAGSVVNMNSGKAGYDGILTDERVRRAVGYALDRDLMDQRATGGLGQPTSALLAESSRFYDGQQGPEYNVEEAQALIEQVKAENPDWNGELTLLISDGPENVESGVVVKALLDAAGFNTTIENAPISQVTARMFTGDYEITTAGVGATDADATAVFYSAFSPIGATNLTGINDPELVAAVTELKAADGLDAQKAAFTKLQEVYNRVMPFAVYNNAEQYVVISEDLKGVVPTLSSTMLFDGAYLEN